MHGRRSLWLRLRCFSKRPGLKRVLVPESVGVLLFLTLLAHVIADLEKHAAAKTFDRSSDASDRALATVRRPTPRSHRKVSSTP